MDNFNKNNNNVPNMEPQNVVETVDKASIIKKEILDWVITICVALLIAFILKTFFLTIANVKGPSMLPTLRDGDILYVNKFMYTPEKGDVVIVDMESRIGPDNPERYHVKRVIATEGDTLYIDQETGDVYINDVIIDEPYINNSTINRGSYLEGLAMQGEFSRENPLVIGENEVFVMGDNRQRSLDCRENGPYTVDMIEGHALFRLWPFGNIGSFDK